MIGYKYIQCAHDNNKSVHVNMMCLCKVIPSDVVCRGKILYCMTWEFSIDVCENRQRFNCKRTEDMVATMQLLAMSICLPSLLY